MALSNNAKEALRRAVTEDTAADELEAAINSGANPQAASVAALGATADLTAVAPAATSLTAVVPAATAVSDLSTGDTYTDASVNAIFAEVETAMDLKADNVDVESMRGEIETAMDLKADNADVEALRVEIEDRLDDIESKVDEIIAALKAAALMA